MSVVHYLFTWQPWIQEKLFKYFEMRSGDPVPLPDQILDAFRFYFYYIIYKGVGIHYYLIFLFNTNYCICNEMTIT